MSGVLRDRQQFFYRQIRLGDFMFGHCYILAKLALADSVTAAKRHTGDIPNVSHYFAIAPRILVDSLRLNVVICSDADCRMSAERHKT